MAKAYDIRFPFNCPRFEAYKRSEIVFRMVTRRKLDTGGYIYRQISMKSSEQPDSDGQSVVVEHGGAGMPVITSVSLRFEWKTFLACWDRSNDHILLMGNPGEADGLDYEVQFEIP